ncbi:MAG: glycosyltransferase family 2 protein [Bacteroidia bacterium]
MPKLSYVLASVGRYEEVKNFFAHIYPEDSPFIEVVLCDQNLDDRLDSLVKEYEGCFPIKHLRTPLGLSISRNRGIVQSEGEFIAIPDDDCFYEPCFAQKVIQFMESRPDIDILVVKWRNTDPRGFEPHAGYQTGWIKEKQIFGMMSSELIFRRKVFEKIGLFDENLGLGAPSPFQGGEDYEILLRSLKNGLKVFYNADLSVFHPYKDVASLKAQKTLYHAHLKRLMQAGASDYYLFLRYFSFLERIRYLVNNSLMIGVSFLKGDRESSKNHFYRVMGFLKAMYILRRI